MENRQRSIYWFEALLACLTTAAFCVLWLSHSPVTQNSVAQNEHRLLGTWTVASWDEPKTVRTLQFHSNRTVTIRTSSAATGAVVNTSTIHWRLDGSGLILEWERHNMPAFLRRVIYGPDQTSLLPVVSISDQQVVLGEARDLTILKRVEIPH